jgi:hypothetical protein
VTKKVTPYFFEYKYKLNIPYWNKDLGDLFRPGIELA